LNPKRSLDPMFPFDIGQGSSSTILSPMVSLSPEVEIFGCRIALRNHSPAMHNRIWCPLHSPAFPPVFFIKTSPFCTFITVAFSSPAAFPSRPYRSGYTLSSASLPDPFDVNSFCYFSFFSFFVRKYPLCLEFLLLLSSWPCPRSRQL